MTLTRQVFFLPMKQGQRLCIYTPPAANSSNPDLPTKAGCILHIHAFGEEMNRCRRMAALTASRLARQGLGVLQMDLYGCGDSSADFADAEWEIWKSDIVAGLNWLKQKHTGPHHIWADRLGALLALDLIHSGSEKIEQLLLCQPVFDGKEYVNQLNRIRQARALFNSPNTDGMTDRATDQTTTHQEIAGYTISSTLMRCISELQPANWVLPGTSIHWLEMTLQVQPALPQKRQLFLDNWGNAVQLQIISGTPYWQSPEISVSNEWIDACCNPFRESHP